MDDELGSLLRELEKLGAANDAQASARHDKMLNITPDTGELLAILVLATKARRVLEIGTSNGYSTLWLADAVKVISGTVVTVDVSAAKAELARRNIERSGLSAWVRQEVTDAGEFLAQQSPASFDMLFLDANRARYVAWWPSMQQALSLGGLLVVDNAVSHAAEMKNFRDEIEAAPGWRSLVVPIGKGELVALKAVQ